jgi:hypothetical protein
MPNPRAFLKELRTAAWRTSGARYNAARRLRRREWFATFSIAMFSVIGVCLAVFQRVYATPPSSALDNYLTAASIFLGLFVLVISLIEAGSANAVRAELLHRNAEELNALQRKIGEALAFITEGAAPPQQDIEALRLEYEQVKGRCAHNHEPLDAARFDADHRLSDEFKNADGSVRIWWVTAQWTKLSYYVQPIRYFVGLWLIIGLILWLTPWGG